MIASIALVVFWLSAICIAYTYLGYGVLIALLARWRGRPVAKAEITPSVTVLVAAYNEQSCIAEKIENTLALDYPSDLLELAVVADGSTDRTPEIVFAASERDPRVHLLFEAERRGKSAALIRAFPLTRGEVVLFSDANSMLSADALRMLVRNLADPEVGGASGSKRIVIDEETVSAHGESLYWRYESFLKACDSAVSSVMGVPGEIWATRRKAWIPPDKDTLLDDFVSSLRMVASGWRVIYEPAACAMERASPTVGAEWTRRSRNAAGGWQALFQLPGMLRHKSRLVTWQYLSHRILRWMVTPTMFVLLPLANVALLGKGFYVGTLAVQAAFYSLALLGGVLARRGRHWGVATGPFYVCLLNAAALVGGWRYLRKGQSVLWKKVR